MKILIFSRGVPNPHDPQDGNFELDQAKALKAYGHEVVIVAVDSRVRKYWRTPGIEKRVVDGITTYKCFLFPTSLIRRLLSFKLGVNIEALQAKWLYRYVQKHEGAFDLIHAHYLTPIFYATRVKEKFNIPIVGTEHWSKVNTDQPSPSVRYMADRAYPALNKLITVSSSLRSRVFDNFQVDSSVIHNLIDTSYLLPLQNKKDTSIFNIVLVGSLIPLKGFDYFLKSLSKSSLINKPIKVTIIGGGSEFDNLNQQIQELGLEGKVSLMGQQPKKVIFEFLSNANIFVLPSRTENFNVSVLEALANGVPVIATICGGIKECINDSNGLLVEVDNEDQMVNALEKMYTTHASYDANKIQTDCLNKYSPTSIAKEITALYQQIKMERNE